MGCTCRHKFAVVDGLFLYHFVTPPVASAALWNGGTGAPDLLQESALNMPRDDRAHPAGFGGGGGGGGGGGVEKAVVAGRVGGWRGGGSFGGGRGGGEVETNGAVRNLDMTYREYECRINVYGGLFLPVYYLRLLHDLPQTCGC
jgi:hypothetical protein